MDLFFNQAPDLPGFGFTGMLLGVGRNPRL